MRVGLAGGWPTIRRTDPRPFFPLATMPLEKSAAVILRVVDFSDTSCVVTMFTREFGKISVLAKGARRRKNPFEAALDVLSICHVVFVHKTSDALDVLTEAKLERRFRAASKDLACLYAAYYFVELTTALTDASDPQPELFDLLREGIVGLDNGERPDPWILRFEMRLLAITGHAPALDFCATCGRPVGDAPPVWFCSLAGGVICPSCRPGKRGVVSATPSTLSLMRRFAGRSDQWRGAVTGDSWGPVRGLLNQHMAHVLGYRPKLSPYLPIGKG